MGRTRYLIAIGRHYWERPSKIPKTAISSYIDFYEFNVFKKVNGKIKYPAVFSGLLKITPTNYATIFEKRAGKLRKVWSGRFSSKYRSVEELIRKVLIPKIRRR